MVNRRPIPRRFGSSSSNREPVQESISIEDFLESESVDLYILGDELNTNAEYLQLFYESGHVPPDYSERIGKLLAVLSDMYFTIKIMTKDMDSIVEGLKGYDALEDIIFSASKLVGLTKDGIEFYLPGFYEVYEDYFKYPERYKMSRDPNEFLMFVLITILNHIAKHIYDIYHESQHIITMITDLLEQYS